MIVRNKSNKNSKLSRSIFIFLLFAVCLIFITNPSAYSRSCLDAITVWALNVLPVLFPFFIFTRLIVNLVNIKPNFMDKFFKKVYHTPSPSFLVYVLSIISGYPMGAKLICTLYENNSIDKESASKMLSFCSVSGPMFIIGTVGVGFLNSYFAGVIILIANIIASLLNGLIYRGKSAQTSTEFKYESKRKMDILSSSVYDSLVSILMVGAYIVLSFLIIDVFNNLGVFNFLANTIYSVSNLNNSHDIVASTLIGTVEMTRGILEISNTQASLKLMTIISSTLISFGGVSIILQSLSFLEKLKMSAGHMILQKFTQAIICLIITIILSYIFL